MTKKSSSNFRVDINGLRAIAVMVVVFFHFDITLFKGGFIGVDIFFVISGFLMTGILFRSMDSGDFNLWQFYLARARRIIPALLVVVLFVLFVGWFFVNSLDYKSIAKHSAASVMFLSNFVYVGESGYFDSASHEKWLLHTWSLSVEWQFYILYPILIIGLRLFFNASKVKVILLLAMLLSLLLSTLLSGASSSFYLLHTRAWEMLLGGIVYLYPLAITQRKSDILSSISILIILICVITIESNPSWPGLLSIIPVSATAIIIACNNQKSWLLSNSLSQAIGAMSYSIYLWHWPLIVLMKYFGVLNSFSEIIGGVSLSILLGWVSYTYVEKSTKKYTPYFKDFKFIFVTCLCVVTFGSAIYILDGASSRLSERAKLATAEANNKNPRIKECLITSGANATGCHFGRKKLPLDAIVLGDSHAMSVMSAIYDSNPNDNKHMMFFGYSACPTILSAKLKTAKKGYECQEFLQKVIQHINRDYPEVPLIIINRSSVYIHNQSDESKATTTGPIIYFDQPQNELDAPLISKYNEKYTETLCQLTKNRAVYLLMPVPEMNRHVPKYMEKQLLISEAPKEFGINLSTYQKRSEIAVEAMQNAANECGSTTLLNPTPYLCKSSYCQASEAGRPLYFDSDHLSEFGNKRLVPLFSTIWR